MITNETNKNANNNFLTGVDEDFQQALGEFKKTQLIQNDQILGNSDNNDYLDKAIEKGLESLKNIILEKNNQPLFDDINDYEVTKNVDATDIVDGDYIVLNNIETIDVIDDNVVSAPQSENSSGILSYLNPLSYIPYPSTILSYFYATRKDNNTLEEKSDISNISLEAVSENNTENYTKNGNSIKNRI